MKMSIHKIILQTADTKYQLSNQLLSTSAGTFRKLVCSDLLTLSFYGQL